MSSTKKTPLQRLLEGLESAGVKRGTRNKAIVDKTGYSLAAAKQILSGNATLTPRFIQAVCTAFGIDREWVELGDDSYSSGWRERVAAKYYEETGEFASPEDIESGNVRHQSQNHAKLLRLHDYLTTAECPERGRQLFVSHLTGYLEADVVGMLLGISPLTDDFLHKLCSKLKINKSVIELGKDMPVMFGEYQTTLGELENRIQKSAPGLFNHTDPRAGGDAAPPVVNMSPLDAPTQEIVNDMKRLTESNRWVFVGRVKPIIQAMIEEQGEVKEG